MMQSRQMKLSPSRSVGSSSRDRLPTFQQLAMSHSSSNEGSPKEQLDEVAAVEQSVQNFLESTNQFQPVSPSADHSMSMDDASLVSVHRIGSGSRSQWDDVDDAFGSPSSLAATKELDLALGKAAPLDMDEMSTYMPSEATYDHSEATARTGNVSSSSTMKRVTPENSPSKGRGTRQGSEQNCDNRFRNQPRVFCGALDDEELNGTLSDVTASVRLIISSVRSFGPDEKDAVRETFKDAKYFMKEKVRSALLRKSSSNRSPDQVSVDNPKRRRDRGSMLNMGSNREDRGRRKMKVDANESEEVVYNNKYSQSEQPVQQRTRMLV